MRPPKLNSAQSTLNILFVAVKLTNGIGNQLFQYAAAVAQAHRLGCPVLILERPQMRHVPRITRSHPHRPHLVCWFPNLPFISTYYLSTICALFGRSFDQRIHDILIQRTFTPTRCPPMGAERYEDTIWRISKRTLLDGYFQSPKYFGDYTDLLRYELYQEPAPITSSIDHLIKRENIDTDRMVCVHVRLGDYRHISQVSRERVRSGLIRDGSTPHAAQWIKNWDLPKEYFFSALKEFDNPDIALFSDEPDEAIKLLPKPPVWVSTHEPITDFWLMRRFKKIIISNSSFSWWAAWLSSSDKHTIVISPKYHIGYSYGEWYPRDIQVSDWIYV